MNYRGSTGYGRACAEALYGAVGGRRRRRLPSAAARYLADRGLADRPSGRSAGGSAGGYTTLCALTFRDVFRGGDELLRGDDLEPFATTRTSSSRSTSTPGRPVARGGRPGAPSAHRAPRRAPAEPAADPPGRRGRGRTAAARPRSWSGARERGLPYAYLAFEGEQHGFRKAERISHGLGPSSLLRAGPRVSPPTPPAARARVPPCPEGLDLSRVWLIGRKASLVREGARGAGRRPYPCSERGACL